MSIFIDEKTKVLVQGITGKMARFHTKEMIEYGTNVVAGVTPGKAGEIVEGVPVFDTVKDAVQATGAEASLVFCSTSIRRRFYNGSSRRWYKILCKYY